MKKDNVYRFTLQFPGKTEEQIQAGDFLERLGSKKSKFLVSIICDYLRANPDAGGPQAKIRLETFHVSRNELRSVLEELLAERGIEIENVSNPDNHQINTKTEYIDDMLEYIDSVFE